jgi:hypothetical protein
MPVWTVEVQNVRAKGVLPSKLETHESLGP